VDLMPQPESQAINLQEYTVEMPDDQSLPAAQVIEEQNNDADATRNHAPRFIP